LFIVAACLTVGCGKDPAKQALAKAEVAVDEMLDAWARGEAPEKLAEGRSIRASDPDWKAGYRLSSFLSVEAKPADGKPDHVRCRVALSLQDRKGKKVDKEVVYDVQMSDPIVIGRD